MFKWRKPWFSTEIPESLIPTLAKDTSSKAMDIMNMTAYFASGDVQRGIFVDLFSDREELADAIEMLMLQSLVKSGSIDDSIFISDTVQAQYRKNLERKGMRVTVLKQTLSLMNQSRRLADLPHYVSVYNHAKLHPELLKDLDLLPGHIVWGLSLRDRFEEVFEFGTECKEFLMETLGEFDPTVLHLQIYMAPALMYLDKEEAIRMLKVVLHKNSPTSDRYELIDLRTLEMLAAIVLKSDRSSSAERQFRWTIFQGERVSECLSLSPISKWVSYAIIIHQYDFSCEAKTIFEELIIKITPILGPYSETITEMKLKIAMCLYSQSKFDEAMKLLLYVSEIRKNQFISSDERNLKVQYNIGKVLKKQGEFEKSLTIFRGIAIAKKTSILSYSSLMKAADIYLSQHKFGNVINISLVMGKNIIIKLGLNHPMSNLCILHSGESFLGINEIKRASGIFRNLLNDYYTFGIKDKYFERLNLNIRLTEEFKAREGTLHCFAKDGKLDKVVSCITKGDDIQTKDANGLTPLHYASAFERVEVARVLIKHGAKYSPKPKLPPFLTPLPRSKMDSLLKTVHSFFVSVKAGDHDLVEDIASKNTCVIGARDDQGCTALHWAALCGHVRVLKTLLKLGCDPTVVSDKGNSPLHTTALKGHVGIAEALLRTLDRDKVTLLLDGRTVKGGSSPLHVAAEMGHDGMVRVLLTYGAVFCPLNSTGMTPVELCKDVGLLETVGKLFLGVRNKDVEGLLEGLEKGDVLAVLGAKNEERRTLVQVAMENNSLQLAKNLVKLISRNLDM